MNKHRPWLDIAIWLGLYLFWILVFQKRAFVFTRTMTVQFCYLLFIAGNFYLNVYITLPYFLYKKKYGYAILLFLSGIVMAAVLRVPLAQYLNKHYFMPDRSQPGINEL